MNTQSPLRRNKKPWSLLFSLLAITIALTYYFNLISYNKKQDHQLKILNEKLQEISQVSPDKNENLLIDEKDSMLSLSKEKSRQNKLKNHLVNEKNISKKDLSNKISTPKKSKKENIYKAEKSTIIKNKKKAVIKKKIIRKTIWNTDLENQRNRDEVSLFIFNDINKLDAYLTWKFKSEFEKRSYFITPEIIFSDVMTTEIAINLQAKNINYFKGNLAKYTDYICIAKAKYSFTQNLYRDDYLDCTMDINYFIYSTTTGEILLSEKDKVIGSDQNKDKARKRAIEKFVM